MAKQLFDIIEFTLFNLIHEIFIFYISLTYSFLYRPITHYYVTFHIYYCNAQNPQPSNNLLF